MYTDKDVWNALEGDDLDLMEHALASRPELARVRDGQGVSLLVSAAYRGKKAMEATIRSHLDTLDIFEVTVLGRTAELERLLSNDPTLARTWSPDGFSPLHLAAFFGHPECVRLLVAAGADVSIPARNSMSVTPLGSAAARCHREIAEILLSNGADVEAAQTGGFTPLHSAAHNGDEAMVELLLTYGADVGKEAGDGRKASDFAREANHHALAQRLE